MAFADLSEFFDDRLHLPINGVVYDIPSPDHELGLWVTALVSAGLSIEQGIDPAFAGNRSIPQLRFEGDEYDDGSDEAKLYQRLLGDAYGKMRADDVSWPKIKFVAEVTMLWIVAGEPAAERHWNAGGAADPKAIAAAISPPNRAARRRATASTPTDGASTTGAPGSTKDIRSRSTSRKP
jgi:hypothetical protein